MAQRLRMLAVHIMTSRVMKISQWIRLNLHSPTTCKQRKHGQVAAGIWSHSISPTLSQAGLFPDPFEHFVLSRLKVSNDGTARRRIILTILQSISLRASGVFILLQSSLQVCIASCTAQMANTDLAPIAVRHGSASLKVRELCGNLCRSLKHYK